MAHSCATHWETFGGDITACSDKENQTFPHFFMVWHSWFDLILS